MDDTLFLENKLLASTEMFNENENVHTSSEKKTLQGNQKQDETFDFSSDIIDLLLCVENDENARQNIESIMDQWDEMNILNEDGSTLSMNSDPSFQLKSKNLPGGEPEKVLADSSPSITVNSTGEASPFDAIDESSMRQEQARQSLSSSPPASKRIAVLSPLSTLPAEQNPPSSDDNLDDRIRSLFCVVCGQNYEQIMNTGRIKKMTNKPHPCPFCRGNYFHKLSARIHMKVHIEEEELRCRVCVEKQSAVDDDLPEKKRSKRDSFVCSICSLSFESLAALEKHADVHRKTILRMDRKAARNRSNLSSSCRGCRPKSGDFASASDNACRKCVHRNNAACQTMNYTCNACGEKFLDKSNFNFHRLWHSPNAKGVDKRPRVHFNALDHSYVKPAIDTTTETTVDENENVKYCSENPTTTLYVESRSGIDANNLKERSLMDQNLESDARTSKKGDSQDVSHATKTDVGDHSLYFLQNTTAVQHSVGSSSTTSDRCHKSPTINEIGAPSFPSSSHQKLVFSSSSSSTDVGQNLNTSKRSSSSANNADACQSAEFISNYLETIMQQYYCSSNEENPSLEKESCTRSENDSRDCAAASALRPTTSLSVAKASKPQLDVANAETTAVNSKDVARALFPASCSTGSSLFADATGPQSSLSLAPSERADKRSTKNELVDGATARAILPSAFATNGGELVTSCAPAFAGPVKNYLVVYASSPSGRSPTGTVPLVTELAHPKDVSSSSENRVAVGLPSAGSKIAYLVPINGSPISFAAPKSLPAPTTVASTVRNVADCLGRSEDRVDPSKMVRNAESAAHESDVRQDVSARSNHALPSIHQRAAAASNGAPSTNGERGRQSALRTVDEDALAFGEKSTRDNENASGSRVAIPKAPSRTANLTTNSTWNSAGVDVAATRSDQIEPAESDDVTRCSRVPADISLTEGNGTFQYLNCVGADAETVEERPSDACVCEICYQRLPVAEYVPHLKTHINTVYKCIYCQKIFIEQSTLLQHMRTHLQPQVFDCKLCRKSFTNAILYRLHLLVHKGLLFICVSCVKLFNKKEEYENHLRAHETEDPRCDACGKRFSTVEQSCERPRHYTCAECLSSSKNVEVGAAKSAPGIVAASFVVGQPNVSDGNPGERKLPCEDSCFECPYCDQICVGGVSFKRHKQSHATGEIKCFVCGQHFDQFSALQNHLYAHTFRRVFKCVHCVDIFYDKKIYQNHSHENFKSFACALCEKCFATENELFFHHSADHAEISEIICNYCGARVTSDACSTHKLMHVTEDIVTCHRCRVNFLTQLELNEHLKTHQQRCSFCDEHFESVESLSSHICFHKSNLISGKGDENNLNCAHCDEKFDVFNNLLSHSIKLHPDRPLKCFKCSCCSQFYVDEAHWLGLGVHEKNKSVLIPYILKQFGNLSFKLEPDLRNTYNCHLCDKIFHNKVDIIKHVKLH